MNHQYQNAIAKYLTERVKTHADWYHHTGRIERFDLSVSDEMVFHLMYFLIDWLLDQGHTVLLLKNNHRIDRGLTSWQSELITPIIAMIKDKVGDEFDFDEIFHHIYHGRDDKEQLNEYITYQQQILITSYHKHQALTAKSRHANQQESQRMAEQLRQLFVGILRFYYFTTIYLHQDFNQFIQRLHDHAFFASVQDESSNGVIIYYHDHEELYLWLNRSYQAERALLSAIHRIRQSVITKIELPILNTLLNTEQRRAIHQVASEPFSIITGGPGTGKTFTVAQIVLALHQADSHQSDDGQLSLALVAPTGKASQRMAESLHAALAHQGSDIILPEPMTIHRLLGIGMNGTPRYHESNPLPHELIIVDEASMLGTELARHLLCAIKQGARIIFLGDDHQLSAVDAGAVLADLCRIPSLSSVRMHLIESNRFSRMSGIGQLAELIHGQEMIEVNQVTQLMHDHVNLSFIDIGHLGQHESPSLPTFYQKMADDYRGANGFFEKTKLLRFKFHDYDSEKKQAVIKELTKCFNHYRILTASHIGHCGDEMINAFIENLHREYLKLNIIKSPWYHGRPVMILKNRYDLGLFNGDIGICLQSGKSTNELSVYFGESTKGVPVSLLEDEMVNTAYAMTVHKSQGSEFDKVAVIFNEDSQRLLSKELIYTAITRAKQEVAIYTTEQALLKAINTPTMRQTGLLVHESLWGAS